MPKAQLKKPSRRDPHRQRRAPHEVGRFGLLNIDPRKHYVWVNMNDQANGVPKYLADGYNSELYEEDGVRPRIGLTGAIGEEIVNSGMLLMSVSTKRAEEIFWGGPDDESGQLLADEFEERMFERDGANIDRFRGVRSNRIGEFAVGQYRE